MIIATAGHVDHGKTSLVKALTGIDTDRLKEEKQRGLTIDLGFAYTDAETGSRLGFVDVPGHIRFINNMLAGVAAIDFALLVIAADDGVMPQTKEHLDVLQLLGIQRGIIALTKTDRVDNDRLAEVTEDIRNVVNDSFLANADIYPASNATGEGIDTIKLALDIASDENDSRSTSGLFRLAIDRRFSVHGSGIVVTGSVFSGQIDEGDTLKLMPQDIPVRARSLRTQDQASSSAVAGDRCAINLTGNRLSIEAIHRGNWITQNPGTASSRVDLKIEVLQSCQHALWHWTPIHFHSAANHVTARIAILENRKIDPGDTGYAQVVLDEAINVCTGDRFVIRDQAALVTLGGGSVIDPWSVKRGRARPPHLDYLRLIQSNSPKQSLAQLIASQPTGVDLDRFAAAFNLQPHELSNMLVQTPYRKLSDGYVIDERHAESATASLLTQLDEWHQANPGEPGMPVNQIINLNRRWPALLTEQLIADMLAEGKLHQDGNIFFLDGYGLRLSPQEQTVFAAVRPLLAKEPTKPPVLHDLAKAVNLSPKDLEKMLNQVVKAGQLVKPVKNRYFLPEAMQTLKAHLGQAADEKNQFTVQHYRDVAGTGRNLAIEILEYFDRAGVTRRRGDIRQIVE